jgi:hypothetical protein
MSIKQIGSMVGTDGEFHKFEIPVGSRYLLRNPISGDIHFESEDIDIYFTDTDGDYQFLNKETGMYVKVVFKKSEGPFKDIPILLE